MAPLAHASEPVWPCDPYRHIPHVLLKRFPNYADVAVRMMWFSLRLSKADFIAKADFLFWLYAHRSWCFRRVDHK